MSGGAGDDTYIVDSSSDSITENESEGTDKIYSSATFITPDNVENLNLTEEWVQLKLCKKAQKTDTFRMWKTI